MYTSRKKENGRCSESLPNSTQRRNIGSSSNTSSGITFEILETVNWEWIQWHTGLWRLPCMHWESYKLHFIEHQSSKLHVTSECTIIKQCMKHSPGQIYPVQCDDVSSWGQTAPLCMKRTTKINRCNIIKSSDIPNILYIYNNILYLKIY